jgi:hypothetical protein
MGILTAIDATQMGSGFAKLMIGICAGLWGALVAWEVMIFGKILLLFKTTGTPPAQFNQA